MLPTLIKLYVLNTIIYKIGNSNPFWSNLGFFEMTFSISSYYKSNIPSNLETVVTKVNILFDCMLSVV